MMRAIGRLDEFLKNVVEPFVLEISFLLRHPFLQPEVRFDDEFLLDHGWTPPCVSIELNSRRGLLRACRGARQRAAPRSFSRARPSAVARRRRHAFRCARPI